MFRLPSPDKPFVSSTDGSMPIITGSPSSSIAPLLLRHLDRIEGSWPKGCPHGLYGNFFGRAPVFLRATTILPPRRGIEGSWPKRCPHGVHGNFFLQGSTPPCAPIQPTAPPAARQLTDPPSRVSPGCARHPRKLRAPADSAAASRAATDAIGCPVFRLRAPSPNREPFSISFRQGSALPVRRSSLRHHLPRVS